MVIGNVSQSHHAFCSAAMDIHIHEPLKGNSEQGDGSVLILFMKKYIST
jgi:hypothetical protein